MQTFNTIFKNDRYDHIYDYSFIYFYLYNMKEMERRTGADPGILDERFKLVEGGGGSICAV